MKILLIAINAKYIHSSLAIYSLAAYCRKQQELPGEAGRESGPFCIEMAEYTINQQADDILQDIYKRKPDVLCFSSYIWNISYIEAVIKEVYKILPETDIWLGGPEVSYDAGAVLERLPQIKGVIKGEGEKTLGELCELYREQRRINDSGLQKVQGIAFRNAGGQIVDNPWREPVSLDEIPFGYENLDIFQNKIIYYETSRGCPFSCSYCLSSVEKRLRFRSLPLVKRELQSFIDNKVPQVKFVDRTFNCRHEHAMAIWEYIAQHDNGVTNFHFEVAADLLREEELSLIETMRPGLIQLEIGVQSTNPDTIREIRRTMDFEKVKAHVGRIKKAGNIHQHLDLIAGLPYEDMKSFVRSFDAVYRLEPDQLQLGFLKVLKGSYMEENKDAYGLVCKTMPPYEVLYTKWLSYGDVLELKGVEEMVEVYYNSGQFSHTMRGLGEQYDWPYEMYRELWRYYGGKGYLGVQHKRNSRYEILLQFVKEYFPRKTEEIRELLIYDYYLRENVRTRPSFAGEHTVSKEFLRMFYEKEAREYKYLPQYRSYDKNQMRKMTHVEKFAKMEKVLLFDYKCRNPLNQEARTCMIKKDIDIEERTEVN